MNIECQARKDLLCITQLVPICSNHIMFAYHLCDGQIKMTERSDSTNHQSSPKNRDLRSAPSINNSQSGSGSSGLGLIYKKSYVGSIL